LAGGTTPAPEPGSTGHQSELRQLELVVGCQPPSGASPNSTPPPSAQHAAASLPATLAAQVAAGAVASVRFEGGGVPLANALLAVPRCLRALRAAGYTGLLRAGDPPLLVTDADWRPKGLAADLGYLRALLQTLRASG